MNNANFTFTFLRNIDERCHCLATAAAQDHRYSEEPRMESRQSSERSWVRCFPAFGLDGEDRND